MPNLALSALPTLHTSPILPVVVVQHLNDIEAIAEGLIAAGIKHIEITLRTPQALPAMAWIAKHQPSLCMGAGTVLSKQQADRAHDHGAQFFVSPGYSSTLAEHMHKHSWAWVPGVATASECLQAQEAGFQLLKFFPAQACGGTVLLKALGAVFQDVRFIPTGGITADTLGSWAALTCVAGVGGTWLCNTANSSQVDAGLVRQHSLEALQQWRKAKP
jgi:2-dehydro-3-deoxyphosphogluconate aldolase/(4S)-4-hydroxy-2-oxoglutarate aldolase